MHEFVDCEGNKSGTLLAKDGIGAVLDFNLV